LIKKQIRKTFLTARANLSMQEMHQYLAIMLAHFQQLPLADINCVLSYLPLTEKGEPTPQYFEELLDENFTGYQLCFPKTNFEDYSMEAIADDENLELITGKYGITEPFNGKIIAPERIDLIFVPLVAFDIKGFRVGYGKGFYDRFIPRCRKNVLTIGLSFFPPVDEIADVNEFDIPLKYCITPQQLYEF